MKNTPSPVDRPQVRSSLIVSLAVVLTVALTSSASRVPPLWQVIGKILSWADTRPLSGARTHAVAAKALPVTLEAASDSTNENVGCGCAESCLVSN